eukprot:GILI01002429.1.p1 GENE.GILI01002429.1~~GILI01002429.1.p1  ORF type:complete len:335 (-),score=75.92 GILI01002429.1:72-1076(-)
MVLHKIEWAPLNIPFSRRLQTLSVFCWLTMQLSCIVMTIFLLFNPFTSPFLLGYLLWAIFIDKAPQTGSRRYEWFRKFKWWQLFRDYFPTSLHKTADLDPSKNYIFGYHPHGIISLGAFSNFATDATGFSQLFPGIKLRLLTLASNFKIPIFREFLLYHGLCDVSRESCNNILRRGPGNSIMIVIGGAAEALDAHPKTYTLTLAKRKGFVKVALTNGASLVPVISFGETDVYAQVQNPKGSALRKFQKWMQGMLGFSLPLFFGRGVFNYSFGLMPLRQPIHSVVGEPVDCPKTANPSNEMIDEYHAKYVENLIDVYNRFKNQYAVDRKQSLCLD